MRQTTLINRRTMLQHSASVASAGASGAGGLTAGERPARPNGFVIGVKWTPRVGQQETRVKRELAEVVSTVASDDRWLPGGSRRRRLVVQGLVDAVVIVEVNVPRLDVKRGWEFATKHQLAARFAKLWTHFGNLNKGINFVARRLRIFLTELDFLMRSVTVSCHYTHSAAIGSL